MLTPAAGLDGSAVGVGPPSQRTVDVLRSVTLAAAKPSNTHDAALAFGPRMKPRPCTMAEADAIEHSASAGRHTYCTSSHMVDSHAVRTALAAASALECKWTKARSCGTGGVVAIASMVAVATAVASPTAITRMPALLTVSAIAMAR